MDKVIKLTRNGELYIPYFFVKVYDPNTEDPPKNELKLYENRGSSYENTRKTRNEVNSLKETSLLIVLNYRNSWIRCVNRTIGIFRIFCIYEFYDDKLLSIDLLVHNNTYCNCQSNSNIR